MDLITQLFEDYPVFRKDDFLATVHGVRIELSSRGVWISYSHYRQLVEDIHTLKSEILRCHEASSANEDNNFKL